MRIQNIFLCWILFVLSVTVFAQSTNYDWNNMIGFACFKNARTTISVRHIEVLIKQKDFDSIKILMNSPIPAIKYLSIKTCEVLERKGMIHFSADERVYINEIKKSSDTLYYCSGCTEQASYTIMELFADNSIELNKGVNNWIKSCLKIEIQPR
jgi:hypothetical protein